MEWAECRSSLATVGIHGDGQATTRAIASTPTDGMLHRVTSIASINAAVNELDGMQGATGDNGQPPVTHSAAAPEI